jgi:GTP-binding protein Era
MSRNQRARAGRVAILGRPNVGKSTLMNALVKEKLAIVAPRPGTTRSNLLGVAIVEKPPTRIAFVDTPGIGRSKTPLHDLLADEARQSLLDVHAVCLVTEIGKGRGPSDLDRAILASAREMDRPVVVAVNKVDLVKPKELLLPVLEAWSSIEGVAAVVPLSALTGENLEPLVRELRELFPPDYEIPGDDITDRPMRFFAAELVREAILRHTRDEVPHGVAVHIDSYLELEKLVRIAATIIVEKSSHKGIVLGKRGSRLKEIGIEARTAIEGWIGRKVYLELFVKVVEGWTSDPVRVREIARGGQG